MNYSDYSFYKETYCGELTEAEYSRLAPRAAAEIDRLTFGRAKTAADGDLLAVKNAECAVIDEVRRLELGGDIMSETNDGISRSYAANGAVVKSRTQKISDAAAVYLMFTDLMFAGV